MSNKEPGYVYILNRSTFGRFDPSKNNSYCEDYSAYQGAKFFSYNGKVLIKREQNLNMYGIMPSVKH